jgi:hypothetical protein
MAQVERDRAVSRIRLRVADAMLRKADALTKRERSAHTTLQ